jgi:hypothetical protein
MPYATTNEITMSIRSLSACVKDFVPPDVRVLINASLILATLGLSKAALYCGPID